MPADFLEEYNRKEYQKHLKVIVKETNKLLKTDYNLISFNLLKSKPLLQVLFNIMARFSLTPQFPVEGNENIALFHIFIALNKIKYDPQDATTKEFREGVVKGDHKIIYPILHWILTNQQLIEKRSYLSRFVQKVEVPGNIQGDSDLQIINKEYDTLIENFWNTYRDHKQQLKRADETDELDNDIGLIKKDISNISFRLETQREKLSSVPKKDVLINLARQYHEEANRKKAMQKQYDEASTLISDLEECRKSLRQSLEKQKMARLLKINPYEQIQKEINMNKLIFANQLPREILNYKRDFDICELIANGEKPTREDLEAFQNKVEKLYKEVYRLGITKSCSSVEATLEIFRKHVDVLSNKRKEISDNVCQLKQDLIEVDLSISECVQKEFDIVGGEVLHGEKLKAYVNDLREQSLTYKKLKPSLQSVNGELSVANRTLDILFLIDPTLKDSLNDKALHRKDSVDMSDIDSIKGRIKVQLKGIELQKLQLGQKREELMGLQELLVNVSRIYYEDKQVYESIIGELQKEIEPLKEEISSKENLIREQQELKQKLSKEIKVKEELFVRLSEEYINSFGDGDDGDSMTMKDILNERVKALEKSNLMWHEEIIRLNNIRKENDEQEDMFRKIMNILSDK